jgi:hypothetical protein
MLHLSEDPGETANCLPKEKKHARNEVSPRFQMDPNTRIYTTPKWPRTLRLSDQNSAGVSHIFHMLFTRERQKCLNGRVRRSMKKRTFLHIK